MGVVAAALICAGLWGWGHYKSVDARVNRILHQARSDWSPNWLEQRLISWGFLDPPTQSLFADDTFGSDKDRILQALVDLGPAAVPTLIEAMADANSDVRRRAMFALGRIGGSRATGPLIAHLDSHWNDTNSMFGGADGTDVWPAIEALGRIGDRAAVDALLVRMAGKGDHRYSLVMALGASGDPRAIPVLARVLSERIGMADMTLTEDGPCGMALRKFGPTAVEPLLEMLARANRRRLPGDEPTSDESEVEWQCIAAIEVLAAIGDARAVGPLIEIVNERDKDVIRIYAQDEAAMALGVLGDERAIGPLEAILKDKEGFSSPDVAKAALVRLRKRLGHRAASQPVSQPAAR